MERVSRLPAPLRILPAHCGECKELVAQKKTCASSPASGCSIALRGNDSPTCHRDDAEPCFTRSPPSGASVARAATRLRIDLARNATCSEVRHLGVARLTKTLLGGAKAFHGQPAVTQPIQHNAQVEQQHR